VDPAVSKRGEDSPEAAPLRVGLGRELERDRERRDRRLGAAVTATLLEAGWHVVVPYVEERELERVERHPRLQLIAADLFEAAAAVDIVAAAGERLGASSTSSAASPPAAAFTRRRRGVRGAVPAEPAPRLPALPGGVAANARRRRRLDRLRLDARGAAALLRAAGYISSKAAVLAFVDALAAEYTQDGVRANAILPSVIDTPGNRASQPEADHSRWVAPAQIAQVIEFLCSERSSVTSGAHIPVYGRA